MSHRLEDASDSDSGSDAPIEESSAKIKERTLEGFRVERGIKKVNLQRLKDQRAYVDRKIQESANRKKLQLEEETNSELPLDIIKQVVNDEKEKESEDAALGIKRKLMNMESESDYSSDGEESEGDLSNDKMNKGEKTIKRLDEDVIEL